MTPTPRTFAPLTLTCVVDEKNGRLKNKTETSPFERDEFSYAFDDAGRLIETRHNGRPLEEYRYSREGRRIRSLVRGKTSLYAYDAAGRLLSSGRDVFTYDGRGALAQRRSAQGDTFYEYGGDTLLDAVILPDGSRVQYSCGPQNSANPLGPERKFKNGGLAAEYAWRDMFRLDFCRDYELGLEYRFAYNDAGALNRVDIADIPAARLPGGPGMAERRTSAAEILYPNWSGPEASSAVFRLFGPSAQEGRVTLSVGCDQVGTPKIFLRENGALWKKVFYDSFGNVLHDSAPELFIPIGFAGGLHDCDTGLVRFGYRDYDTTVGRFTAPDPLGDTGGDHDLYDYCVDDPVTRHDPTGLNPLLLYLLSGMGLSGGLGFGTAYGAAKIADDLRTVKEGKEVTASRDGMKRVLPAAIGIHTNAFLPAQVISGTLTGTLGRVLTNKASLELLMKGKGDSGHTKIAK